MSPVVDEIRVNGTPMSARIRDQIIDGALKLSSSSVTSLDFTVLDTNDLTLTQEAGNVFREGTTVLWRNYAMTLTRFETGGGTTTPTVEVSATSEFVYQMTKETGGQNWGTAAVAPWAETQIIQSGAWAVVQPTLGEREIEREEPPGDHRDAESTWDVMAEMAKQTGAWLYEYQDRIVLAKPSWIVAQPWASRYKIHWNTWTDHTDGLVAAPAYSWDDGKKPYDGKEELQLQVIDPAEGASTLSQMKPGDIIEFTGAASVSKDPTWLVTKVAHPLVVGLPVKVTAWRPIDPPEIIPKSAGGGDGGASAGVPNGPLGEHAWQGEQLKNASEIVKEGQRRELPRLAIELAVACAMGESSLRYTPYGDAAGPDSLGLFQQRDTWGSKQDRLNPAKAAGFFYDKLVTGPYKNRYTNGANALAVADTGPIYIGPGKSGNSASVAIHHVQINADPTHYAKFWNDAQLVVKECISAGKDAAADGEPLPGPLGQKVEKSIKGMEGRYIEFDGAFLHQCVDVAKQYIADLTGMRNVMGNGNQYWMNPSLAGTFSAINASRPPRRGDLVSWSGSRGAYRNGGVGHVAVFSHSSNGQDFYLSQNPGPARIQPLVRDGVLGWMRPKD